jgi:hypothetical protein
MIRQHIVTSEGQGHPHIPDPKPNPNPNPDPDPNPLFLEWLGSELGLRLGSTRIGQKSAVTHFVLRICRTAVFTSNDLVYQCFQSSL